MASVTWTKQALFDVDNIAEYIAQDSKYYAKIFVEKIFTSITRLEVFPESGRVVPELNNLSIREIILGNYRIIYRVNSEFVEILTVYHSARLLGSF